MVQLDLDEKISIILRKICDEGKIETTIPRKVVKKLLLLCTKHVHFTFNRDIYTYNQDSLLATFFMCSLEETIIPILRNCLVQWKRDVDDTHAYINPEKTGSVMRKLNSYLQT